MILISLITINKETSVYSLDEKEEKRNTMQIYILKTQQTTKKFRKL